MAGRWKALVDRVQTWKPVRVVVHYSAHRGPLLASGLAFQAMFAVFAALWAAFSIAGLIVSGDLLLQDSILGVIRNTVPGLIDDGTGSGAIDPDILTSATVYNITGALAIVGLLFTALGWLASVRDSVRAVFALPGPTTNFFLQKLFDLGVGLGFGALLAVAGALSFAGTSATRFVLDGVGIDPDSMPGTVVSRIATLAVMLVIYAVALAGLYRLLSGIRIPWRLLRMGALVGAVGIGALTVLGTVLLGGATSNPLVASFAVIAGLLIYFDLVSQVILLSASWIAIEAADAGVALDGKRTRRK